MHVHTSFFTLIGSSDSLDLYIQVFERYPADQVFGEDHMLYVRSQSSLCLILQLRYLFFLILIDSLILCILDSAFIPFWLFMEYYIIYRNLYVILQWYLIPS